MSARRILSALFGCIMVNNSLANFAAAERPDPAPEPGAVVTLGDARFTVLTPALIRIEWSPSRTFEDRASLAFINRRLAVPKFDVERKDDALVIRTNELVLRFQNDGKRFHKGNLSIEFALCGKKVVWRPGMKDTGNLLGTFRTLDGISGATSLEPGILSHDGWVLVDDSHRLLFDAHPKTGDTWVAPRKKNDAIDDDGIDPRAGATGSLLPVPARADKPPVAPERCQDAIDWYFFGYGHDYKRALGDFVKVAGRIPLPPRFAFGTWWSRYWAYTDKELKQLVREFREHDVPLDVLVIDMDWHLDGWTGYTWDPKCFPDPEGFLKWVHEQGLKATLNLHPADGVGKREAAFPAFAKAMGLDPKKVDRVPFDCTEPKFVEAYFKLLHHPLEKQGIDFWWIDWQQGHETKVPGLDPLWWLNHLHWTDMQQRSEKTGRRPLIFSRWGGLGNHRYQIGFSGDAFSNWPSLAFQPSFTATAANVGYGYWSHDIGGHIPGPVDPELYARWIQYGVFSPILRTHTTKNPKAERRIWEFPKEVFEAAKKAFELRYELIPYIYAMARKSHDTGVSLCRPLYYDWPQLDEAYEHPGEYMFGDDLLVAPVVEPIEPISQCAMVKVWLPPGEWTNWFSGQTYEGPRDVLLQVPLDEIPIFVRSGAIIPTMEKVSHTGEKPVDKLVLNIWPGESGETRIYEDDGISAGYLKGKCAWTPVSHELGVDARTITIGQMEGSFDGALKERAYEIRLRDVETLGAVRVDGAPLAGPRGPQPMGPPHESDTARWFFDLETTGVIMRLNPQPTDKPIQIVAETLSSRRSACDRKGYIFGGGLRGFVRRLRDVAEIFEDPRLVRLMGDAKQDEHTERKTYDDLWHVWIVWQIYHNAVMQGDLDYDTRQWALMRLLELVSHVEAVASGTPDNAVQLEVGVGLSVFPDTGCKPQLQVNVSLEAGKSWTLAGDGAWVFDGVVAHQPVTAKTTLRPVAGPQTTVVEGTVSVSGDESVSVDVPIRRVLLPSINAWWVLGPFGVPFDEALDRALPPEKDTDLKAKYKGMDGEEIAWRKVVREIAPGTNLLDEFFIDFDDVYGGRKYQCVSYALTYLHAPEATDATLALGTDDGVRVWLNGKQVHRFDGGRAYTSKEDRVPVKLRKGSNTLLLKISQGGGDSGFCVHVEDADGNPLTAVRAELKPSLSN